MQINSYSMFKLVLLHLSDQEVCNVYRSRGNTTAACKHVTRNLFFSSFFFLFNSIVLLSPSFPPLTHSGHSEPKRVTARGRSGSKDTDGGERADLRTLGVEQKPGPVSRSLGNARAKLGGWASAAAARNHSRQTGFQKKSCCLEGVGVPAHPAAKSKLFPRWWVDYMQRAFSAFQLLAFRPCDREDNVYTLALNLLVGKYKKRSSYCTLGRCRERRTGCRKYFVILELYRCKNIMFLK